MDDWMHPLLMDILKILEIVYTIYNPSTQDMEAGGARVQGHPGLYGGFEASSGYTWAVKCVYVYT